MKDQATRPYLETGDHMCIVAADTMELLPPTKLRYDHKTKERSLAILY